MGYLLHRMCGLINVVVYQLSSNALCELAAFSSEHLDSYLTDISCMRITHFNEIHLCSTCILSSL